MADNRLQDKLQKDVVTLLHNEPFYGHILVGITKIIDTELPAAAAVSVAKYITLKVNPDMYFKEKDEHRTGILKHELLHVILKHVLRGKKCPLRQRANVAADLAVNPIVGKSNLPEWTLWPELYELPTNLTFEQYYDQLPDSKVIHLSLSDSSGEGEGEENPWLIPGHSTVDEHNWDNEEEGMDPVDATLAEIVIDDIIRQATKHCGDTPSELKGLIHYREKKTIPWQTILRRFFGTSRANLDYTKKRISKRYGTRPGTKFQESATVVLGVDSSGSISDKQLDMFMTEVAHAHKTGLVDIWVVVCDCEIHEIIHPFNKANVKMVSGRGGTDFRPVIEWAESLGKGHPQIDSTIMLTDGYGPAPEKRPRFPVLWVLTHDGEQPAKWGQVLRIPAPEGE